MATSYDDAYRQAVYPNVSGVDADYSARIKDALSKGNYGSAAAQTIRGGAALIPAAAVDAYNGVKQAFQPAADFGYEVATGAPPRRAADAAGAAASKAATKAPDSQYGMNDRSGVPRLDYDPNALTAPQQTIADQLQKQDGGVDPAVARQALPSLAGTTDLVQGRTAIPAGAGGYARLNYGDNNVVVGSKTNGSAKINNFVGYGGSAATGVPTAAGAGGPSPLDAARARINDMLTRADLHSQSGTLQGKILATGLYKRAAALQTGLGVEAGLHHGMSALGLEAQKAAPGYGQSLALNDLLQKGDYEGARKLSATLHGQNPNPLQVVPTMLGSALHSFDQGPGSYVTDPKTGQQRFVPEPITPLATLSR